MNLFNKTRIIIILAVLCRVFGILTSGHPVDTCNRLISGRFIEQMQTICLVNPDEILIAEVAINHHYGLSYASTLENHRQGYIYDFTAFRPSYPVYLHLVLQSLYYKIFSPVTIGLKSSDPYFIGFSLLIHGISLSLFIISLFYFRKIARYFFSPAWANATILLYAFYPSVMFYVGNFANYESIVTSLLIINMAIVFKAIHMNLTFVEKIVFIISVSVSVLFRPQLDFIYFVLFFIYILIVFQQRKVVKELFTQGLKMTAGTLLLFVLLNVPVLVKNYRLFHGWTLGTTGFSFSLSHNPYARGDWCGNCFMNQDGPYYHYIREEIPGYESLNEFEKADQLTKLSIQWMFQHPLQELVLDFRKLAIYFLPYNNDHLVFNFYNLIVHIGSIIFLLTIFLRLIIKKEFDPVYWLLGAPLMGSMLVTVIFHSGYRWRYYAEPFMVLIALIVLLHILRKYKIIIS